MTTNRVYVKTFTSKVQANVYYNKVQLGGNLTSKSVTSLAGTGLWEVRRVYTVSKQHTNKKCTKRVEKC